MKQSARLHFDKFVGLTKGSSGRETADSFKADNQARRLSLALYLMEIIKGVIKLMSLQWTIAIGTGILALVALFQHHIKSWLTTPLLCISTKSASPYCKKLLFSHSENPSITADGYAIRISVKNITPFLKIKSRIEEAEVFLAKLDRKEQDGKFHPVQGFEPANLL